ncbi:MAG: hypothetical protein D3923_14540, partial [Candidatus Electrothrix sp. AR3]|nr:hypothetical protein [Candidatus Electrothrix sp. AR3]
MYQEESVSEEFYTQNSRHLRDYLRIILKRKGLILTVTVLVFLIVALSTFSKIPVYTASTRVLVEKNTEANRLEGFSGFMTWDPDFQATQFELIRSFNVALRVVKNLQLDTKNKSSFSTNKANSPALFRLVEMYVASFFSDILSSINASLTSWLGTDLVSEDQPLDRNENQLKLQSEAQNDAEKIAASIQRGIQVDPVQGTKLVKVSYSNQNPAMAQLIANAIVQAYIDETLDIKTSTTRHTVQWMSVKAEEERKKLEASEKKLQQYMRSQDIVTVENRLTILPERLASFSSELSSAQTKEKEYQAIYRQIKKAGKSYKALEELPLFAESAVLQALRTQLLDSEQNIRKLARKYGVKHPIMKKAKEEQQVLRREKRGEIDR